ncbi:MAG: DUF3540 domain-containing protein [Minicystis sp.]
MNGAKRARASTPGQGAFEAEVVAVHADGAADVRRIDGPSAIAPCRSAVPGYAPTVGDRVVVIPLDGGAPVITGVLGAAARVRASSGASAGAEGAAIVVRDAAGEIVARYDGETGALTIAARADVVISAPGRRLDLEAREIALRAEERVGVEAPALDVTARGASLHAEEASVAADAVRVVAAEVAHAVGRWEVRVERLIERAAEAYREAELAETRADRARVIAKAAFDVVAGRASILSDDDAVIDGKRVLLG